jgi:hypothetical protein
MQMIERSDNGIPDAAKKLHRAMAEPFFQKLASPVVLLLRYLLLHPQLILFGEHDESPLNEKCRFDPV